jgi:hypothetical protein
MAKGPGVSQAPLNPHNAPRAVVRWWPHSKGGVKEGIDIKSSPCSTFRQTRCPLCACLLTGLEGIQLPLGPPGFINDSNPCAPSAMASPPLDLCHVAQRPVSQMTQDGGARQKSSNRRDRDTINHLHGTLEEGVLLEIALPASKEAP